MLRKGGAFIIAVSLGAISSAVALDLTPMPREYTSEGFVYTELRFKDGDARVSYVPPPTWNYSGSPSQLQLTAPSGSGGNAIIDAVALPGPQPLDESTIPSVREQFLQSLPPNSSSVKVISEERNPLLVGGTVQTYEVAVSYEVMGEKYARSMLFANFPGGQLRFRLTAATKDFYPLHRAFRSSILSWTWSDPNAGVPAGGGQGPLAAR